MNALLFLTLGVPAATGVLLLLFRDSMAQRTPRWVALAGACAALFASLLLAHQYRDAVGPWSRYLGVNQCAGHGAS